MADLRKLEKRQHKKVKESTLEDWELIKKGARIEKAKFKKNENDLPNSDHNELFLPI